MATRPAWYLEDGKVKKDDYDFLWHPGLAPSQKKKNVRALHESIGGKSLEVSTKSENPFGLSLSPFNLTLDGYPMESVYHASKTYEHSGPHPDLVELKPLQAKRDERHESSGEMIGFTYKDNFYPLYPKSYFFNYLYYLAVQESILEEDLQKLLDYDYFTDIEFNPKRGVSNQARAIALVKSIFQKYGYLPELTKDEFYEIQKDLIRDGVVQPWEVEV